VFTKEDGEAWHPEVVSRFFRAAVKRSRLPELRLHDLCHTHATLALQEEAAERIAGLVPAEGQGPASAAPVLHFVLGLRTDD